MREVVRGVPQDGQVNAARLEEEPPPSAPDEEKIAARGTPVLPRPETRLNDVTEMEANQRQRNRVEPIEADCVRRPLAARGQIQPDRKRDHDRGDRGDTPGNLNRTEDGQDNRHAREAK